MNSAISEVLFTSSSSTQQWSVCAWDFQSGNALQLYKSGGVCSLKSLTVLAQDYLIAVEQNKPLLRVWPLNGSEQPKNVRLVLPEFPNAISVCPNNLYMAVGIGLKLYVWHLTSGKLLNVQQKHFQPITCIQFSSDGDYLITAGQDGMLATYNFADLINVQSTALAQSDLGQIEPLYTRMDNSMPISDIYTGSFGYKARLATVSSDHTCRLYSLFNGELLLNLVFEEAVTCVITDSTCWNLYVGSVSGLITKFNLTNPPRSIEKHTDGDRLTFSGHEKRVNCLDLNLSGNVLVSGGDDSKVYVWDTDSRQILREIDHKGAVTNVKFCLSCENLFAQTFKPKVVLKSLERVVDRKNYVVSLLQDEDVCLSDEEGKEFGSGRSEKLSEMESEVNKLKIINAQMYNASLQLTKKLYNM